MKKERKADSKVELADGDYMIAKKEARERGHPTRITVATASWYS